MRINFKIFAVILAAVILFSTTVFAEENSTPIDESYDEAVSVLLSLGIITDSDKADYDAPMTRAEVTKIITNALGLKDSIPDMSADETLKFSDVSPDYWAAKYIKAISDLGMMSGTGDQMFEPDKAITYQQIVKILVCALGYDYFAQQRGGYPSGYMSVASDKKITKNTKYTTDFVSKATVFKLVYNALDTEMLIQSQFGASGEFTTISGKTLMSEKLKVAKEKGQVTANEFARLAGLGSLDDGKIEINGSVFNVGTTNANELLGYSVTLYHTINNSDSSDETILYIAPDKNKNDIITVTDENIISYSNQKFNYWLDKENSNDSKIITVSKSATIILNGKGVIYYSDSLLKPTYGKVTLIDSKQTGMYDVVLITSYTTYVVGAIDTQDLKVFDENNYSKYLTLDSNNGTKVIIKNMDGEAVEFGQIKQWDVLTVAQSEDNSLCNVIVCSAKAVGEVSSISISDTEYILEIANEKYKLNSSYWDSTSVQRPKVGDMGAFYLDAVGKIVALNLVGSLNSNYAYMVEADFLKGIDKRLQFKLFNYDGSMLTLKGAEKIKFNDKTVKRGEDILAIIGSGDATQSQVILYQLNIDGDINSIDTAYGYGETPVNESKDSLHISYPALPPAQDLVNDPLNVHNILSTTTDKGLRWNEATNTFGGKISINDKTIIFSVPPDKTDDDLYSIKKPSALTMGSWHIVEGLSIKADSLYSNAVVLYDVSQDAFNYLVPIMLVDKTTNVINSYGDQRIKISGYTFSGKTDVFVDMTSKLLSATILADIKNLKSGDIIRSLTNVKGDLSNMEVVFKKDTMTSTAPGSTAGIRSDYRIIFGAVYANEKDIIQVIAGNATVTSGVTATDLSKLTMLPNLSKYKIYKFVNSSTGGYFKSATSSDILSYKMVGADCSKVLVHTLQGSPRMIVIFE